LSFRVRREAKPDDVIFDLITDYAKINQYEIIPDEKRSNWIASNGAIRMVLTIPGNHTSDQLGPLVHAIYGESPNGAIGTFASRSFESFEAFLSA
jgi:hypothetical protein